MRNVGQNAPNWNQRVNSSSLGVPKYPPMSVVQYGIPEIGHLSDFHHTRDFVSPACGVRRAFSFLYQREGRDQVATETHQYPTLAPPITEMKATDSDIRPPYTTRLKMSRPRRSVPKMCAPDIFS